MLRNYVKTALRSLLRYKGYTAINILGLAVGITACILIFIFVQHELSYDRFHANARHIYRIHNSLRLPGGVYEYPTATAALAPAITREISGVQNFARLLAFTNDGGGGESIVRIEDRFFKEKRVYAADPEIFDVFSFRLLKGSPQTALTEPFSVVLTEALARKYFPGEEAMGKSIYFTGANAQNQPYTITGILESIPPNSHVHFDMLASMASLRALAAANPQNNGDDPTQSWNNDGFYSYIRLAPSQSPRSVEAQLPALVDKHVDAEQRNLVNPALFPLTDIHLRSSLRNEMEPNGSIGQVYIFGAVALFILLIAGINYMNLATARSARRAREVGMRKVVGAERSQLIIQFLGESVLVTLAASVLALGLAAVLLPLFNSLTGKTFDYAVLFNPALLLSLLGIILFIGLLSGSYPALFLSSFKPVEVLKGNFAKAGTRQGVMIRKGLVTFQFTISIVLVICTWMVFRQISYLKNKNLGFTKEHVLVIKNTNNAITPQLNAFKNELRNNEAITNVSASLSAPGGLRPILFVRSETMPGENNLNLAGINVDFDYLKTLDIPVVQGRDFDPSMSLDSTQAIIINQQTVKELNLGNDPVGKIIEVNPGDGQFQRKRIIGVVNDINFEPLYRKTEATFFAPLFPFYSFVFVRTAPGNRTRTIAHIEQTWNRFVPDQPLDYYFLDDNLNQLYQSEEKLSQVITYFSAFAILVASLGLFGLASFSAEQRTKEIGIRKVLGATNLQIVLLLFGEYSRLIILATVLSWPLAYYLTTKWIENFVFHSGISWVAFLLAGMLLFIIALGTVSFKAFRAARTDPAKSLRTE
jgi:putative ABC transport system permease protein